MDANFFLSRMFVKTFDFKRSAQGELGGVYSELKNRAKNWIKNVVYTS